MPSAGRPDSGTKPAAPAANKGDEMMNNQRGDWLVWEKVGGAWQLRGRYEWLIEANRVLKECRADGHQAVRVAADDATDRRIRANLCVNL